MSNNAVMISGKRPRISHHGKLRIGLKSKSFRDDIKVTKADLHQIIHFRCG